MSDSEDDRQQQGSNEQRQRQQQREEESEMRCGEAERAGLRTTTIRQVGQVRCAFRSLSAWAGAKAAVA